MVAGILARGLGLVGVGVRGLVGVVGDEGDGGVHYGGGEGGLDHDVYPLPAAEGSFSPYLPL